MAIKVKWAVNFDPEKHEYTDLQGNRLRSVTEVKNQYMNRTWEDKKESLVMFNKNKAPHITAEFLDERREIGGQRGRIIHEQVERWVMTGQMDMDLNFDSGNPKTNLNPKFWQRLRGELEKSDLSEYDKHYPEIILCDPENGLCGRLDLPSETSNRIILTDWKSNQTIEKKGNGTMHPPLDSVINSDLMGFAVQMSLYWWLLTRNGNDVDPRMFLRHITPSGYLKTHVIHYIPQIERLFDF